jgi:hypothetical protein
LFAVLSSPLSAKASSGSAGLILALPTAFTVGMAIADLGIAASLIADGEVSPVWPVVGLVFATPNLALLPALWRALPVPLAAGLLAGTVLTVVLSCVGMVNGPAKPNDTVEVAFVPFAGDGPGWSASASVAW